VDHQPLTDNLLAELSPTPAVNPHGELTARVAAVQSQVAALAAETAALAALINAQAAQASMMRALGMRKFAQFRARGWARLQRVWQRLVQGTRHGLKRLLILLLGRERCLRARTLIRGSPGEPQDVTKAAA
jgi:hypothetical protein